MADIHDLVVQLIYRNDFYARLFSGINKIPNEKIPTARVVVSSKTYLGICLEYNPEWVTKIASDSIEALQFILEHEGYHLLAQHIQRWLTDDELVAAGHDCANVAMDMAANCILRRHFSQALNDKFDSEELGVFPEKFDFEEGYPFEGYMRLLLQRDDLDMEQVYDNTLTQPHEWNSNKEKEDGTPDESDKQVVMNKLEYNLPNYVQEVLDTHVKSTGQGVEEYLKDMLDKILKPRSRPNWGIILKSRVATGMPSVRVRYPTRMNRRLLAVPGVSPYPGRKIACGFKFCVIIDTSCSMSQRDCSLGLGLLLSLLNFNPNMEIHVIEADTEVRHVYQVRSPRDLRLDIHGRGGTDFCIPIALAEKEIQPDIIGYITDGYGMAPSTPPNATMIWCITEHGQVPAKYGTVIECK